MLPGMMALLVMLRRYQIDRANQDQHIRDWTQVTYEDFNEFRRGFVLRDIDQHREQNMNQNNGRPQMTPAKEFRKGTKRDPDAFPTLKEDTNWDTFLRSFNIQAAAQDSTRVLDSDYIPETEDEQELFKATNDYMLSVFDKKLTTSQATAAIHKLAKKPYPAQKIWKSVREHNEASTTAAMQSSPLMAYLTSIKWNSPEYRWKGGSASIHPSLLRQDSRVRRYEYSWHL